MSLLIAKRMNIKLKIWTSTFDLTCIQISTKEDSGYLTLFLLLNFIQLPRDYVYKTPNGISY